MASTLRLTQLHRRMPAVFGPFPGPRQSFDGLPRDGSQSTSVEAFLTFKTTQVAISDLLPLSLSFQKTGKDAFVTVAAKQLGNLEWLGGRGYSLLSVYVHGVQHVAPSGRVHQGTFLPVLWENMADPIISGREELGYPKIFGDLDIKRTEETHTTEASWQGTVFAHLQLEGLEETEDTTASLAPLEAGVDSGLLLHRYIPTPGQPGEAEADYPVFIDYAAEKAVQPSQLKRKLVTTRGRLTWHPHSWQELPTLHHIVRRLAEIPCLDIVAAGVAEKLGNSDLSTAKRVDG